MIQFEDDHLLVVNKPAGWNTHAPAPYAGEGVFDWLRHREPQWEPLAIVHRLDKETSGLLVFGKSTAANRSLTAQFAERTVRKRYLFLTDRPVPAGGLRVKSTLRRRGDRYGTSQSDDGVDAETRFERVGQEGAYTLVAAEPLTGRTHQIRVHAAESGFAVLGDERYGGAPYARVCLHAAELDFWHPVSGRPLHLQAGVDWQADPRRGLREACVESDLTNAYRLAHGAADGRPGWYVDRLGDFLLSQAEHPLDSGQLRALGAWLEELGARGAYHKTLERRVRASEPEVASPRWVLGELAPEEFEVRENGVRFRLSFSAGYSVGLFLDQRENRRRLLVNHVAGGFGPFVRDDGPGRSGPGGGVAGCEVLNVFAYTCGFSVVAALAGARTTSLDLSRKYLDWGRRNFEANGLEPSQHDFIYGDASSWLNRLARKQRQYDVVILDPPTFSTSKDGGTFRAEKDYGVLVARALPLLRRGGALLASANAARLAAEAFVDQVTGAIRSAGRVVLRQHYVPQPPDFPIAREEPAHLKTLWLRVQ